MNESQMVREDLMSLKRKVEYLLECDPKSIAMKENRERIAEAHEALGTNWAVDENGEIIVYGGTH